MIGIKVKPLSVNEAWQGKRYKTPKYKVYESEVLYLLPKIDIPDGKLKIKLEFGLSSSLADWDNPIKPFVDILQTKYGFNDSRIYEAEVKKTVCAKGAEYIMFSLESLDG
jgi:Holliday junction resolvase RusA-like endonuclease